MILILGNQRASIEPQRLAEQFWASAQGVVAAAGLPGTEVAELLEFLTWGVGASFADPRGLRTVLAEITRTRPEVPACLLGPVARGRHRIIAGLRR